MISVKYLTKKFQDKFILNNLSFEIDRGEVFSILGPNGAGKTTIVRILSTLLSVNDGSVKIGKFYSKTDAKEIGKIISVSGQYTSLDEPLTGRENLIFFSRLIEIKRKGLESIVSTQLDKFGLLDSADKLVSMYSGGMKRCLDLAVALVRRPQILFLDEPTTGLDSGSQADLWQAIRELRKQEVTVILTTEYLEEADQLADEVVLIDQGSIKVQGTPAHLKSQYGQLSCSIQPLQLAKLQSIEAMLKPFGVTSVDMQNAIVNIKLLRGMESIAGIVRQLDKARVADISIFQPSLENVFYVLTDVPDVDCIRRQVMGNFDSCAVLSKLCYSDLEIKFSVLHGLGILVSCISLKMIRDHAIIIGALVFPLIFYGLFSLVILVFLALTSYIMERKNANS